ncbi:MAG: hypothetical protein IPP64_09465 [Bacteroidetes bacterium]|nr:hypothetical protein [Bacteroidota bacterium]
MKKIFFTLFLTVHLFSSAQTDPVKYSLTRENTDIKFIQAKLAVWDILISSSRMTFSGGLGGKLYLNGLYVGLNYDYQYLDNLAEYSSSENIQGSSIYKPQKSRNADATVGYFFQKEAEGKIRINLKSHGKTTYYTKVDAKYNKIFGVQAGFKKGFSHMTIPQGVDVQDAYLPQSGTFQTQSGMTTYMNYSWVSVGPTYGKIEDVEIDVEGLGLRRSKFFQRFYGNVLIATSSKLEDVYMTENFGSSNELVHQYVLDGNVEMSKIGFNIGYETYRYSKVGVGYGIEIGAMPGVKISGAGNGYLLVKWGIIFGKQFGG